MIVVATEDFELYHGVVTELRERGAAFTTVEPGAELPERTRVVLAGDGEDPRPADAEGVELVCGDPESPREAVDAALSVVRDGGRTVVGVDPGDRPGIAVLSGRCASRRFRCPPPTPQESSKTRLPTRWIQWSRLATAHDSPAHR